MNRYPGFATIFAAAAGLATAASAQNPAADWKCDGRIVSRIEVTPQPPPFSGYAKKWQAAAHTVGLHHATTRSHVVRSFLSLHEGSACTEFRRSESERVLRAQPFLSDASVRVVPDTGNTVVVEVTTVDEVPVLVTGRARGVAPQSVSVGNENVGGEAIHVAGRIEKGGAYRNAFGTHLEDDAMFGHPFRLALDADRYEVGHRFGAELEHPFFTNLQRFSWHTGITSRDDYIRIERPARDPLAFRGLDKQWDLSGTLRVFGTSTVTLVGAALIGREYDPAAEGIVISDSGFLADTGVTLRGMYRPLHVGRAGIIGGIRRVLFQQVNGFDALIGTQDVAEGAMIGVFAGKGLPTFGESDFFVSSAAYVGAASRNAFTAAVAQGEARRDPVSGKWDSIIGSARGAFYWGNAPGIVFVVNDELSGGKDSRLPLQLSFRENDGGMIGYRNSGLAGALRNILHTEVRWAGEGVIHRADVGVAAFTEVGTLRAGDAPYGVNANRVTAGLSLLSAYPSRSKRMYRVDVGFPFTRGGAGGGAVEVRFTNADRTNAFWTEPMDVSRARTGTEPSRLFAWPNR